MSTNDRVHALDAVRAFALLLGVVFHAGFSFLPGLIPGLWAINDDSTGAAMGVFVFVAHIFRMTLFFIVAGFFARMLYQRGGARGFWSNRLKRILVPLVAGWVVVFPLLAAVWIWGLTRTFGTLPTPPAEAPPAPAGAFPFGHLWFLYYLLVLYAIVTLIRAVVVRFDGGGALRRTADLTVRWLVQHGAAGLVLAIPVAVALYVRADWVGWWGIPTPDRSVIPELTSLVVYGVAVSFGWLLHRQTGLLAVWSRQWPYQFAVAAIATLACLWIAGPIPSFTPIAPGPEKLAFAFGYALANWSWSLALIGLAMRVMTHERPGVRYVADASYWIYLVHMPVVAALQVGLGRVPLHWTLKFPVILAVSFALLFASYHYLVRSTFIGQVLNGRRYPRTTRQSPTADAVSQSPVAAGSGEPVLAALTGVHKRYGKTVALAGLDLEVRRGELLAVLGPNGAGKSTAIALWLGLLEPDAGTALLFGGSPLDVEMRRRIGVMMQEVGLTPELRVRELIALTASYYPNPLTTAETLALTRTTAIADRPYAKLSGGQKRQVQFALAVCGRPALLFLDEPTVGLDVEARETMWAALRGLVAQGCSIVLTTHYLEEAEALANRVAVLAGGRLLASGSVDDVRSVVSRKQISCVTSLGIDQVASWPEVIGVRTDAHRLQITVADGEGVVRRLLAADPTVRDLEIRRAGLAEAFVQITKEAA